MCVLDQPAPKKFVCPGRQLFGSHRIERLVEQRGLIVPPAARNVEVPVRKGVLGPVEGFVRSGVDAAVRPDVGRRGVRSNDLDQRVGSVDPTEALQRNEL